VENIMRDTAATKATGTPEADTFIRREHRRGEEEVLTI
jgi:hypothetical protein